jgi:transketolase
MRSQFSGRLFGLGTLMGLTGLSLALASVPHGTNVGSTMSMQDDAAMNQELSEIRVHKESTPNFDSDIQRLSKLESQYHEKLPVAAAQKARLKKPIQRVSQKKYSSAVSSKSYQP